MAILETLYIMFKGDASQLKKESEQVQRVSKDTVSAFGAANAASEQLRSSFSRLTRQFLALASVSIVAHKFIREISDTKQYVIELNNSSQALGVNIEMLDAWGKAVEHTGGTAKGFQQTLQAFAEHIGTDAKTALKLLPQLADSFQKMNKAQALQYGKSIGLDEPTILLLEKGRREVDSLVARQKELGVITKKDAETFSKFDNQLQETNLSFRNMFVEVGIALIPILEKMFKIFETGAQFFRKHADFIIGGLIGIAGAVTLISLPFIIANAGVILLVASITALIGVFALVYDDIRTFFKGGDSLIGRAMEKWPRAVKVIKDAFMSLGDGFKWVANKWNEDWKKIHAGQDVTPENESPYVLKAQRMLTIAANSPFNSRNASNILSTNKSNSNSVNIGEITINTQATDAEGISQSMETSLRSYLWQANSNFDDGVAM